MSLIVPRLTHKHLQSGELHIGSSVQNLHDSAFMCNTPRNAMSRQRHFYIYLFSNSKVRDDTDGLSFAMFRLAIHPTPTFFGTRKSCSNGNLCSNLPSGKNTSKRSFQEHLVYRCRSSGRSLPWEEYHGQPLSTKWDAQDHSLQAITTFIQKTKNQQLNNCNCKDRMSRRSTKMIGFSDSKPGSKGQNSLSACLSW